MYCRKHTNSTYVEHLYRFPRAACDAQGCRSVTDFHTLFLTCPFPEQVARGTHRALLFTACLSLYRIIPPDRTFSTVCLYSSAMFRVTVFIYPCSEGRWDPFTLDPSQDSDSPKSERHLPEKCSSQHSHRGGGNNLSGFAHRILSSWHIIVPEGKRRPKPCPLSVGYFIQGPVAVSSFVLRC